MFAKPTKKPAPATTGKGTAKSNVKPKTVGVKSGVKARQGKKVKYGEKVARQKCAARPDPGYSLYSTDSEDHVTSSFKEIMACEKILTHLKHKQKVQEKAKRKAPKKVKELPGPKLLNPSIPTSSVSNLSEYGLPYGAEQYLRQHYGSDHRQVSNPLFNLRLSSSTPDPEKHVDNPDANKLPVTYDHTAQDLPERDISAVSSIPPSLVHLRNMADLVGIYKHLETNSEQLIRDETTRMQMEKLQQQEEERNLSNRQNLSAQNLSHPDIQYQGRSGDDKQTSQGQIESLSNAQGYERENLGQDHSGWLSEQQKGQSAFRGTGSLGFLPSQHTVHESSENSSPVKLPSANQENPNLLDSSLTAFQPYLSRESLGFVPPQHWMKDYTAPQALPVKDSEVKGEGQIVVPPPTLNPQTSEVLDTRGALSSKSTSHSSSGTDHVALVESGVEGQRSGIEGNADGAVVYQKQNGLYQVHPNVKFSELPKVESPVQTITSPKAPSSSPVQNQNEIHEIPERDNSQTSTVSSKIPHGSAGGSVTFNVDSQPSQGHHSMNTESMTSTPRNQTTSSTASSCSQGKIVFIPNTADGNTQNMIGYIPGVAMLPGTNQPISWPVTYELAPNQLTNQTGSVITQSSILGNQGQLSQQTVTQDTSGSGYHSAASSQAVAAGDIGVRKLRYLLKELQECNKVSKDAEISRLVGELTMAVDVIPQLATTFNLHTEIDLAIQPLRSENSQLRRKVRIANQQLKDKEQEPKDINFEILHLQTSNEALQKVVREEKNVKTRLAAEVQFLMGEIHKMKVEKSRTIADTSEKDTEQLKLRQESLLDTQKLRHSVDLIQMEQEATANRVEALEKENHILQIMLQQRDAEIERQQAIIDTMKENIGELLHELDQSRSAEKTWDHNTSFGLNKLLRIVEEEASSYPPPNRREPARRVAFTPEKRTVQFPPSHSASSTPRLTQNVLAVHDREHSPPKWHDWPRPERRGPASESEVDTLIEARGNVRNLAMLADGNNDGKRQRRNSSSPIRFKNSQLEKLQHQRSASSPMYAAARLRQMDMHNENEFTSERDMLLGQKGQVANDDDEGQMLPPQRRVPLQRLNRSNPDVNRTEVSVEQSRYSVTDYFRKYPSANQTKDSENLNSRPPAGRSVARELPPQKQIAHKFRTSSEIEQDDETLKSTTNVKQRALYKGMDTISAINDDDNISSVSMTSISTANTSDDRRFRSGIATLDANIAKLQMALQRTKSMLS